MSEIIPFTGLLILGNDENTNADHDPALQDLNRCINPSIGHTQAWSSYFGSEFQSWMGDVMLHYLTQDEEDRSSSKKNGKIRKSRYDGAYSSAEETAGLFQDGYEEMFLERGFAR